MPAASERTVRVEGLRDLQRAFALADRELSRRLRSSLREAAEPVRADAERLATSEISRIGVPWSRMRVGVTQKSVYVAPRQRGARRNRRPNLAGLLLERSMLPALDANQPQVVRTVEKVLDQVANLWEDA
jgi:hypothetical protein